MAEPDRKVMHPQKSASQDTEQDRGQIWGRWRMTSTMWNLDESASYTAFQRLKEVFHLFVFLIRRVEITG